MIPIAKNRGRTVLGVRIGLSKRVSLAVMAGPLSRSHTAMPSIAVAEKQYL